MPAESSVLEQQGIHDFRLVGLFSARARQLICVIPGTSEDSSGVMPASTKELTQRRLTAIMFADVAGFSRAMGRDEEGTFEWLKRSMALVKSLAGDYGGRVVHTAGDGVLAVFDSVWQALNFAIEIQCEVRHDAIWNSAAQPLAFRIGINLGDVIVAGDDVYGQSVNIAARIQAFAPPGVP